MCYYLLPELLCMRSIIPIPFFCYPPIARHGYPSCDGPKGASGHPASSVATRVFRMSSDHPFPQLFCLVLPVEPQEERWVTGNLLSRNTPYPGGPASKHQFFPCLAVDPSPGFELK